MRYCNYLVIGFLFLSVFEGICQGDMVLSADSLYNLGNTAYEEDKFDLAIYYFEKAKLLDPNSEDIAINLKLANEQLSTDIIEIEPFFLAKWWNGISNLMLPGGWKVFSIFLLLVLFAIVYMHYIQNKLEKKNLFYVLAAGLVALLLISILAGKTRTDKIFESNYVIVYGGDQPMYIGPDLISDEIKQLTGGNKLRIIDEVEDWYKVSAMDSEQGWIKKENVKLLKYGG